MVDATIVQPAEADHEHDFHVTQVDFNDGAATTELTCQSCGAIWFE